MAWLPDNAYDLAIADPPYGIGDMWSKSRKDQFYRHKSTYTNDASQKPDALYISEITRVSKNQIIWGANYFCHLLPEGNHWILWDKVRSAKKTFMSEAEVAWHSLSIPMMIFRHQWDGCKKGRETGIKKIHPFQKPVALYKWLLQNYAKPGQTIFDSHVGSGSIRIACHDLGFDFEGCEIDKDYWKAQEKRYKTHIAQADLFAPDEIQGLVYGGHK
jgi:site-specific DNA-methyltransferase (adenine-specific)